MLLSQQLAVQVIAPITTHTYGGFAGVGSATKGSVSVGQVGQERQN